DLNLGKVEEEPCFGCEHQEAVEVGCVFVINGSQHASKAIEDQDAQSPLSSFSQKEEPSRYSVRMPSPPDRCMHDRHERSLKSYLKELQRQPGHLKSQVCISRGEDPAATSSWTWTGIFRQYFVGRRSDPPEPCSLPSHSFSVFQRKED
ncbi:unnamed protein product, partial [Symbiodinium sp. CCMP2592]